MSMSILYHAFGIKGVTYRSTYYLGNAVLFRGGDGKVLVVFAMGPPEMADDHTGIIVVVQFGSGKRTPYNILCQVALCRFYRPVQYERNYPR